MNNQPVRQRHVLLAAIIYIISLGLIKSWRFLGGIKFFEENPYTSKTIFLLLLVAGFYLLDKKLNKITIPLKERVSTGIKIKIFIIAAAILAYFVMFMDFKTLAALPVDRLITLLIFTLAAVSMEETCYRFFFRNYFISNGHSVRRTGIITSVMFSLAHFSNLLTDDNGFLSVFNQVVFAFFMGLLMYSVITFYKQLWLVILFHFLINFPSTITEINPGVTTVTGSGSATSIFISLIGIHLIYLPLYLLGINLFSNIPGKKISPDTIPG